MIKNQTNEKRKYNKIEPYNEFWIDCYSTAIYSILLSTHNVDKRYLYNNNYKYEFTKNVRTGMGRVYITMQLSELIDKLLVNKELHDFTEDEDIIKNLKMYIEKNKVIFLGIDMYYGVPDTSQWHKHHIHHNILVEGYDDDKECMYILETGNSGYKEYELSYKDITIAAREFVCFIHNSEIYDINCDEQHFVYDCTKLKENALQIVQSIDDVLEHIYEIWHVNQEKILSMKDEIESHLRSIRNRQGVNVKLFQNIYRNKNADYYIETFSVLEKEYDDLLSLIIHLCINNQYFEREDYVRKLFCGLLLKEKKIWLNFYDDKRLENFR